MSTHTLLPPTPTACKVIELAARNHQDDLPFDLRAVPNQWLINERARSASLGERILELEQRVRQLETSLWAALEQER